MRGELYHRRPPFADDDAVREAGEAPYIHVRWDAGEHRVEGMPSWMRLEAVQGTNPDQPTGMYAAWLWEGDTLILGTDRLGFYPLFYEVTDGSIRASTSIVKLLLEGASRDLDAAALAAFVRYGFFLGEQTPFKAIRALPANGRVTWSRGQVRIERGPLGAPTREVPREEAMEAVADLVAEAIGRRTFGERLVMPLSGGKDSRMLLFEMLRQGIQPRSTITVEHFAPRRNEDALLAPVVAAEVGLPNRVLRQPNRRMPHEMTNHVETSFLSDEGAWTSLLKTELLREADEICDGLAGDTQLGMHANARWEAIVSTGERRHIAGALTDYFIDESLLKGFLSPELYRRLSREAGQETVERVYGSVAECADPVGQFIFRNRTRREVALIPFARLQGLRQVHTPFCDFRLHEYLLGLPMRTFLPESFQLDTINRRHPQFAHLPVDKSVKAPRRIVHPQVTLYARDLLRLYSEGGRGLFDEGFVKSRLRTMTFAAPSRVMLLGPKVYMPTMLNYLLHLDSVSPLLEAS